MSQPRPMPAPVRSPLPGADDVVRRIVESGASLGGVEELPLTEAAVRFDAVHAELQTALTDLDRA